MCYGLIYSFVATILITDKLVGSYNVDTKVPIIFRSPDKSGGHFGFSVAFHNAKGVLVGAPKADDDKGKVYECQPNNVECTALNHNLDGRGKIVKWFGVSVASQNAKDGRALACSHRYYSSSMDKFKGACLLYNNTRTSQPQIMEPCDNCKLCAKKDFNDCQIGSSAHIHSSGEILLGGPGFYDGAGNIFLKNDQDTSNGYSYNKKTVLYKKYSYLGTSVKIGRLIDNRTAYVTSAPNMEIYGKVFLFTKDETGGFKYDKRFVLTGDRPFSGFGTDMAIGDFNSDGYEDLVVGAPSYYEHGSTIGGAIYIYMNGPEGITSSSTPTKILSRKMKETECNQLKCYDARFGFSLGSAGDLDMDGYPDLAVGAPFEGDGAVYIYPGSPNGLRTQFSQRIAASDMHSNPPIVGSSFGYSISQGPYDVDSNSHPDLAIGSFLTDRTFVLRTRSVVNVELSFVGSLTVLNYKKPSCGDAGAAEGTCCFKVTVCFKYTMKFDKQNRGFDIKYNITSPKVPSKMDRTSFDANTLKPNLTSVISMHPQNTNEFKCEDRWVYVTKNNKDWLEPIALSMSYELTNLVIPSSSPSLPSFDSYPVLNHTLVDVKTKILITFDKNCGRDNVCDCNLKLKLRSKLKKNANGRHEMKASETLKVEVIVSNSDEDAHQTMFYLAIPQNIEFIGTESKDSLTNCIPIESNLLECDIANPLEQDENVTFSIKLNPSKISINQESITIEAYVNSTSKERDPSDDKASLVLDVLSEADLQVFSRSSPDLLFYRSGITSKPPTTMQEIGPQLEHIFEVKNVGKIDLPASAVVIHWPETLNNGDRLFYVVSEPEVSGGKCTYDGYLINTLRLKDTDKPHFERMRRTRAIEIKDTKRLRCEQEIFNCTEIYCSINSLRPTESFVVRIYSRFWNSTFQKAFPYEDGVTVHVKAKLKVPDSIRQMSTDNDVDESKTDLLREEWKEEEAPIWIYLVASAAGLFFLILFIIILWKCGFFKRKKIEGMQEFSVSVTKKEVNEHDLK